MPDAPTRTSTVGKSSAPDPRPARRNAVLNALDADALADLLPHLHEVPLLVGEIAYRPGQAVAAVYFPLEGMVSIVTELDDGEVVEVASTGREGMVGLPVFLGAPVATERAVVQVAGRALRMDAGDFTREVKRLDGVLAAPLHRYTQAVFTQLARNGACNRTHSIDRRAARWLLTVADHVDGPSFYITQQSLAQMLAVRRSTVSRVASGLAEQGCITYVRGNLTILDRDRLHERACGCYDVIRSVMTAATSDCRALMDSPSPRSDDLDTPGFARTASSTP